MVDIRPWLQELYAPAVLVASTPAAEALIQSKNGLGLVDLLRPYASAFGLNGMLSCNSMCLVPVELHEPRGPVSTATRGPNPARFAGQTTRRLTSFELTLLLPTALTVPVRVGETSVRVQDLRVRFFDVATLYQPPPEVRRFRRN